MNEELSNFAARLRRSISSGIHGFVDASFSQGSDEALPSMNGDTGFNRSALELFSLQFKHNAAYRRICEASGLTPLCVEHWTQIPAAPTAAFKELELSCIRSGERTAVFHSSGTTEQRPSRHFHCAKSLAVYEASVWPWFTRHVMPEFEARSSECGVLILTPPPDQAPHSSLVHMLETIRRKLGAPESVFAGKVAPGSWILNFRAALAALDSSLATHHPALVLGTAFSFVHMLDFLREHNLRFQLPTGSRVMETGGYKNRSRSLPKEELHALITDRLGIPREDIICEYGMSELSSQAYDGVASGSILAHPGPLPKERENGSQLPDKMTATGNLNERPLLFPLAKGEGQGDGKRAVKSGHFSFPPWARAQIVSPETGREVDDGNPGLIRVFDLANVFSVMAVQTEDLGIRWGDGFELIGRAQMAEPRGCSLTMEGSASSLP